MQLVENIWHSIRSAVMLLVMMTVLAGGVYPLLVWGVAQVAFGHRADGSLIESAGDVAGSELLGQEFTQPRYFWGRLSANAYDAAASAGSNLSPANPVLMEKVNARVTALHKAHPKNKAPVPVDLVTASASGLDPHISVAAVEYQIPRVAKARNRKDADIRALVEPLIETPVFGLGGEAYVNVLRLNMALDAK